MTTNVRLSKSCEHCGEEFIAKTLYTRYCSHLCNRRHYKIVKREKELEIATKLEEEKKRGLDSKTVNSENQDPLQIETIQAKEFLSVSETAQYLGVSRRTVERAISSGKLPVHRFNRRIIISKLHIKNLLVL
jgi:excisionase family DNA binding protein